MTDGSFDVLWIQAGSCGGCTMSALGAEEVGLAESLAPFGIRFLWHPGLSEATGADVLALLDEIERGRRKLDALCVEGAVITGPGGSGRFQMLGGSGRSVAHWLAGLAKVARHVVAVGSCAAFGGMLAAGINPAESAGLAYLGEEAGGWLGDGFRAQGGLPVVNIAGCAPHPGWIVETLAALAMGSLGPQDLDLFGRPRFFADHLAHHGCSRNEFYEFKASAQALSQGGCLMEHLGCKATQAVGDCNLRLWNGGAGCSSDGYPCIACTAPGFEKCPHPFQETPKVAGIPVGLPVDMPRAWFVALAALSKSATPKRVSDNAKADHVVVGPRHAGRHRG